MAIVKRNNLALRSAMIAISALASLGIWAAVTKPGAAPASTPASGTSTQALGDSNFAANDNFLTQGTAQASAGSTSQYPTQRAPTPRLRTRAS